MSCLHRQHILTHVHHLADSESTYDAVFVGSSLAFTQTEGLLPYTLKSHGIYNSQVTITHISYTTTSNLNHRSLIPLTVRRMLVDITNALEHSGPCQKLHRSFASHHWIFDKQYGLHLNLRLKDYRSSVKVNTTYDAFPAQVVEQTLVLLRGQKQRAHVSPPPLGRVAAHVDGWGGWTWAFVSY